MKRQATAVWSGTGKEGSGTLTTQSKALSNVKYNYRMRFEDEPGTNPEELVAAAHAGCFNMKLSFLVVAAGLEAEKLETTCTVSLEDGAIRSSHLNLKAKISGITNEKFQEIVEEAKQNCPISKSLSGAISIDAMLEH